MRGFSFFGINVGQAAMLTAGVFASNLASAQVLRFLPDTLKSGANANLVRIGTKAGVTIAGAMLLRRFAGRGLGNAWALGGAIATLSDVVTTFVLPAVGLSDYEAGNLTDYQPGNYQLQGGEGDEGIAMSGGENMYADTMYGY